MSGSERRALERRFELTSNQREVIALIAKGRTNFQIAQALGLSLEGVKYHVSEILAKLDAGTREEAVKLWREHNRRGPRAKRAVRSIMAPALTARLAVKAAAWASLGGAIIVAATLLWPRGSDAPQAVTATPETASLETADELLAAIARQFTGLDQILHVRAETWVRKDGVDQHAFSHQAWFDFEDGRALVSFDRDLRYDVDVAEFETALYAGDHLYRRGPDDDEGARRYLISEARPGCLGRGAVLVQVMVCGLRGSVSPIDDAPDALQLEQGHWDGQPALILVMRRTLADRAPERGVPPTPTPAVRGPAPPPSGDRLTWRFYFAKDSLLPLALVSRAGSDPDGVRAGSEQRFTTSEVVPRSALPSGAFKPASLGYSGSP